MGNGSEMGSSCKIYYVSTHKVRIHVSHGLFLDYRLSLPLYFSQYAIYFFSHSLTLSLSRFFFSFLRKISKHSASVHGTKVFVDKRSKISATTLRIHKTRQLAWSYLYFNSAIT